jgi:hypothetical protein
MPGSGLVQAFLRLIQRQSGRRVLPDERTNDGSILLFFDACQSRAAAAFSACTLSSCCNSLTFFLALAANGASGKCATISLIVATSSLVTTFHSGRRRGCGLVLAFLCLVLQHPQPLGRLAGRQQRSRIAPDEGRQGGTIIRGFDGFPLPLRGFRLAQLTVQFLLRLTVEISEALTRLI